MQIIHLLQNIWFILFFKKGFLCIKVNIKFIKHENKITWVPEKTNDNVTELSAEPISTMKEWTGVPAIIHQSSNETVFCYKTNHNTSVGE